MGLQKKRGSVVQYILAPSQYNLNTSHPKTLDPEDRGYMLFQEFGIHLEDYGELIPEDHNQN
jgi:hypothetical protein